MDRVDQLTFSTDVLRCWFHSQWSWFTKYFVMRVLIVVHYLNCMSIAFCVVNVCRWTLWSIFESISGLNIYSKAVLLASIHRFFLSLIDVSQFQPNFPHISFMSVNWYIGMCPIPSWIPVANNTSIASPTLCLAFSPPKSEHFEH